MRSKANQPYLIACRVRGGVCRATSKIGGKNCAWEVWPEGMLEVVSRRLRGEMLVGGGDQGRVRTALCGRYASAAAERGQARALSRREPACTRVEPTLTREAESSQFEASGRDAGTCKRTCPEYGLETRSPPAGASVDSP